MNLIDDPEQFVRDSGVLLEIQKTTLRANLQRFANEHGFELPRLSHAHHPVVEITLYIGNQDERRTNLRCRTTICDLLRSVGAKVPRYKLFVRSGRSVIRRAAVLEW